jgi:hypothetical protein
MDFDAIPTEANNRNESFLISINLGPTFSRDVLSTRGSEETA